jgi:hypothetical protein
MAIYLIGTGFDDVGGGVIWSETREDRKPGPHNIGKWYPTDADRAPLGPYPQDILDEVNAHWALTGNSAFDPPDTFNSITSAHCSGAPIANRKVCDVFEAFATGDIEFVPLKKFWSLTDLAEVTKPYWVVNFYGAIECLDVSKAKVRRVTHPKMGNLFRLMNRGEKNLLVRPGAQGDRHLWRDKNTSDWFCDDVFREAIEAATPKTYHFTPTTEV